MTENAEVRRSPNEGVRRYLVDYATGIQQPTFAVLLNGAWGSGKTYFVKHLHRSGEFGRSYYVSLFGIATREQLEQATLAAVYPLIANKAASALGKLLLGALKVTGFDADLKSADFLDHAEDALFIFDDFERCVLSPTELLGFINVLVEQGRNRVIVVADELRVVGESYSTIREKVFGQSITFTPDFDEIYPNFVQAFADTGYQAF